MPSPEASMREVNSLLRERIAWLETALRVIAHGDWQRPSVDSAACNTYAEIACRMQDIAARTLEGKTWTDEPYQAANQ